MFTFSNVIVIYINWDQNVYLRRIKIMKWLEINFVTGPDVRCYCWPWRPCSSDPPLHLSGRRLCQSTFQPWTRDNWRRKIFLPASLLCLWAPSECLKDKDYSSVVTEPANTFTFWKDKSHFLHPGEFCMS